MRVHIYSLNYNGAGFISDCIGSLVEAVRHSRHQCKVFMIDNCSTDESVTIIRRNHPSVTILPMKANRVLCSFNDAVRDQGGDVVFLLNNDLKADLGFIDPMVEIFERKENVFFVAARSFLFDGSHEGGRAFPFFAKGTFWTSCDFPGYEKGLEREGVTFSAGFGAFDGPKFLSLGGYDDLYLPGRMEDADIMLRAWKKGWKSYYQPKSIFYHMGSKSFKTRYGVRGTMEIAHRNTFLFLWKNIRDPRYLSAHFLWLPIRLVWMLLRGHYEFVTAFVKALGRLGVALKRRRTEKKTDYPLTERTVIESFQHAD